MAPLYVRMAPGEEFNGGGKGEEFNRGGKEEETIQKV